jgi:hypothetical protein
MEKPFLKVLLASIIKPIVNSFQISVKIYTRTNIEQFYQL